VHLQNSLTPLPGVNWKGVFAEFAADTPLPLFLPASRKLFQLLPEDLE
jgi:hypothetical protein